VRTLLVNYAKWWSRISLFETTHGIEQEVWGLPQQQLLLKVYRSPMQNLVQDIM